MQLQKVSDPTYNLESVVGSELMLRCCFLFISGVRLWSLVTSCDNNEGTMKIIFGWTHRHSSSVTSQTNHFSLCSTLLSLSFSTGVNMNFYLENNFDGNRLRLPAKNFNDMIEGNVTVLFKFSIIFCIQFLNLDLN